MEQDRPRRLIIIGLDGAMPEHILKFSSEGKLPNISNLLSSGSFAEVIPATPADTPTNWATIVTGAWTGTHGITSFRIHLRGEPLDKTHDNAFDTSMCQAEFFWDVAERFGKRSIIINYPNAWPPTVKKGIVIGGYGPHGLSDWRISPEAVFASGAEDFSRSRIKRIEFVSAIDWRNVPQTHSPLLETEIPIVDGHDVFWFGEGLMVKERSKDLDRMVKRGLSYKLLLVDSKDKGYDQVLLCRDKDASKPVAALKPGEYSDWIHENLAINGETVEVVFRFKLINLSSNADRFMLYRSVVGKVDGWAYPKNVSQEIVKNVGPFINGLELGAYEIHEETFLEHMDYQCKYLAEVAEFLVKNHEWDLLVLQVHTQDSINHLYCKDIYPRSPGYNENDAVKAWEAYERSYRIVDNMIGRIMKNCCDDETLITIVSDHGSVPVWRFFWVGPALQKAGLVAFKKDIETGRFVVDWNKTKAFPGLIRYFIWVNLKGRDPEGVVEPGEEYESVCDEIIETLYNIVDPDTGKHVVALAIRAKDAEALGLWGERVGDVIYFLNLGYDTGFELVSKWLNSSLDPATMSLFYPPSRKGSHNNNLPSTKFGTGSNRAILIMSGPGVRRNYIKSTPINMVDIAPTLAYLFNIPAPNKSEGKILWDMLEKRKQQGYYNYCRADYYNVSCSIGNRFHFL